ncbi:MULTISPECIES: FAD-binding oxidoreductase [unclassified Nonomuraea]|uniref:FAD-binding oxidoreductase n=1 Tax=unclassified Nonomuraea TaxID=2593643 RepID=UPI0033CE9F05
MTVRRNPVWFPGRFRDRLAPVFSHFNGPVLVPGDPGYDDETARFNTVAGPVRPAVVVGARDAGDIRKAIDHARSAGLRVAVQATGHGLSAPVDGTLLINTRRMTGLSVDPATRTARVGAGVRWGQVVDAAAGHGLAPPNGSSPLVGAVGYTLGGGLPVLGRTFGWAADRVRSLELVTADGTLRTVSPYENQDLFWALRGGRPGVGVVTAIELELTAVPRFHGGMLRFPAERASELLAAWLEWSRDLPDTMNSSIALLRLPHAHLTAIRLAHATPSSFPSPSNASPSNPASSYLTPEELIAPLRALNPAEDTVRDRPYTEIAAVHEDPTDPAAYRELSLMLHTLDADLFDRADPDFAMVEIRRLGGALAAAPDVPNAIDHRTAAYSLTTIAFAGMNPKPPVDPADPSSTGLRFRNFLAGPQAPALAAEAYTPTTWTRLTTLKTTHDPHNLFL